MRISDWSSYVCSSDLTANRSRRSTSSISVRPARSPKRWARPLGTSERQRGVTNSKRKGCNMQNATTKEQAQTATNPVARSEEHTSELQSLMRISYAVFCLTKKKKTTTSITHEKHKTPKPDQALDTPN